MLKETKMEEAIGFYASFLSLVAFQLGESLGTLGPPQATPMLRTHAKSQLQSKWLTTLSSEN